MKGSKYIAVIMLLLMAGALSACRIDLFDKLKSGAGAEVTPRDGQWVASEGINAEIVIKFDSSMDGAAPTLNGDLGINSDYAWTTTDRTNDTLTLTPISVSSWVPDTTTTRPLTVACSTADGVSETLSYSFRVAESVQYVSTLGSSTGTGERGDPVDTVNTGISSIDAGGTYPGVVLVAAGLYTQNAPVIQLSSNISIYGGWATDWSEWDPTAYISLLENTASTPLANPDVNKTIEITSDLGSNDVVVDGFTVIVKPTISNASYAAIFIDKSPVTLRNMKISTDDSTGVSYSNIRGIQIQGDCTAVIYDSSISLGQNTGSVDEHVNQGIYVDSSSPEIYNVSINAGHSDGTTTLSGTWAVFISNSSPYIHDCSSIHGGTSKGYSYGFYISGNTATNYECIIADNDIHGGSGEVRSRGIQTAGSATPFIYNNSIFSESGTDAIGIHVASSSTPAVLNNFIEAKSGDVARGFWITNDDEDDTTYTEILNNVIKADSSSTWSYGIQVWSMDTRVNIRNNTIFGGDGPSGAYAVYLENNHATADPLGVSIENNHIFTASSTTDHYGVYEVNATSVTANLANNNFFNCGVFYHISDGTDVADQTALTAYSSSNINNEIYGDLNSGDEFRFTGDIDSFDFDTSGINGENEGWTLPVPPFTEWAGFTWKGRIGNERTGITGSPPQYGWSIGAHEYD